MMTTQRQKSGVLSVDLPCKCKKDENSFIFKMRKPNYERTPKKYLSHSHYRLDQRNGLRKMKLW